MPLDTLATWHELARTGDAGGLDRLLAENAVFHSPIVHTPQAGKALTRRYLAAAFQVFFQPGFHYVREVVGERDAVLEFELVIDGVTVNGVDMIHWDAEGRIDDFKVMIRPLKAIELIHARMATMLRAGA